MQARSSQAEKTPRTSATGPLVAGVKGSTYHAISESGETVFFTATPEGSEILTLYARAPCVTGVMHPNCKYVEKVDKEGRVEQEGTANPRGEPTGRETVAVSAQLRRRNAREHALLRQHANATFQAASADGSKVFFTTKQKLLNSDVNAEYDLYEYQFVTRKEEEEGKKPKLSLISGGKVGTEVNGVFRSSPDGSHVYFLENGVTRRSRKQKHVAQRTRRSRA